MNKRQTILIVAIVVAATVSVSAAFPITNIVIDNNADGWFTMDNLDAYGDDLDGRLEPGGVVFTGHPAYVIESDDAQLLYDMPRAHYYAVSFRGTNLGDSFYDELAHGLHNGSAEYAILSDMTRRMFRWEGSKPARLEFQRHFCLVENESVQALYNRTGAALYEYRQQPFDCTPDRRPTIS